VKAVRAVATVGVSPAVYRATFAETGAGVASWPRAAN
jgi:hypothetical protein